ncbi:hypothetical protein [Sphingobium agri]|uniref:Uncharacterized protein n=1 Tax=Sphingobium agri TaxID=2933566 RepID=A0ABT0DXB0_9SPHN|nr:hypothetical protein [Sphingobium agri]MCK0531750.1 hypothetical protein [Sphingobium agri]
MQRFKPIAWLPSAAAQPNKPNAFPSQKAQRVELQRIEAACAMIGNAAADEADLRAAFLAIGSALCTEKQRSAALSRRVSELEADIAQIMKKGS